MNYQAHYDRLVQRARERVLDGYVERHHVLPKCMGGTDDTENIVQLTAAEHFVAHQLLCKMRPEVKGLAFAVVVMCGNPHGARSNKLYAWLRARAMAAQSQISKERWLDPVYRATRHATMAAVYATPEFKAKASAVRKGRVKSEQERANIAEAGRNRKPRVFSEQAKANMAAARLKTWEERRGTDYYLSIAKKTRETRIKNGSYKQSAESRILIGLAGIGRVPWNKGLKAKGPGQVSHTNFINF